MGGPRKLSAVTFCKCKTVLKENVCFSEVGDSGMHGRPRCSASKSLLTRPPPASLLLAATAESAAEQTEQGPGIPPNRRPGVCVGHAWAARASPPSGRATHTQVTTGP